MVSTFCNRFTAVTVLSISYILISFQFDIINSAKAPIYNGNVEGYNAQQNAPSAQAHTGLCISLDYAYPLENMVDIPADRNPTMFFGVTVKRDGYYLSGISHHCIKFPRFRNRQFWRSGFLMGLRSRGTGMLITNGDTFLDSTFSVSAHQYNEDTRVTVVFDKMADSPKHLLLRNVDAANTFIDVTLAMCADSGIIKATATIAGNLDSEVSFTSNVSDPSIMLPRDYDLSFGCGMSNGKRYDFEGYIQLIRMACSYQC